LNFDGLHKDITQNQQINTDRYSCVDGSRTGLN